MTSVNYVADWQSIAHASDDGPSISMLHESEELRVLLVALAAGQVLPDHPGPATCFHFLDGEGEVVVNGEAVAVAAGATLVIPTGAYRSIRTNSGLTFLGNLGDPASAHKERC